VPYRQGYLSDVPERSVRIRVAGKEAYITVKGRSSGSVRDEFEYPIPLADAEAMLTLCIKPLIEKRRYKVARDYLTWEIDEFGGENEGLVIAEVELDSDKQQIKKPEWVGKQVTGDSRYFNLSLMHHPYSEWNYKEDP